jgi:hypothetical protein
LRKEQYHSEGEIIRAALLLLEASARAAAPPGTPTNATAEGPTRQTVRPAVIERWETPDEWRAGREETAETPTPARRSPRGLLADLSSGISFDDVREARDELWAGLRHGGV